MSKRVLLVDDNESVRSLLKLYMSTHGYKVVEASDGLDGLTKAKNTQFDLFVIDYKMPVMDGLTLIKGLREMPLYAERAMILLSTDNSKAFCEQTEQLDGVLVMHKPVEQSDLLEAMAEAAAGLSIEAV